MGVRDQKSQMTFFNSCHVLAWRLEVDWTLLITTVAFTTARVCRGRVIKFTVATGSPIALANADIFHIPACTNVAYESAPTRACERALEAGNAAHFAGATSGEWLQ